MISKLKPYYGQKLEQIKEQYGRFVPRHFVPDEYDLAPSGQSGIVSTRALSLLLSTDDVDQVERQEALEKDRKEAARAASKAQTYLKRLAQERVRLEQQAPLGGHSTETETSEAAPPPAAKKTRRS